MAGGVELEQMMQAHYIMVLMRISRKAALSREVTAQLAFCRKVNVELLTNRLQVFTY
jgi:hypothetical protein